eukprot:scaffold85846_cov40-Cyclotella_meneghiniana.AAC.4
MKDVDTCARWKRFRRRIGDIRLKAANHAAVKCDARREDADGKSTFMRGASRPLVTCHAPRSNLVTNSKFAQILT